MNFLPYKINIKNIKKHFFACKRKMEALRHCSDLSSVNHFNSMRNKLATPLVQEDQYWKQRAKIFWLQDGDANTKKFHASAFDRKRRNSIMSLCDDGGFLVDTQEGLCNLATSYFEDLFSTKPCRFNDVIDKIPTRLTVDDNVSLLAPFSILEFKSALFQMHHDKSPGPDGLNPAFL